MKWTSSFFCIGLLAIIISFSSNAFAQKTKTKKQIVSTKKNVQKLSIDTKKFIRDTLFKAYYKKCKDEQKEYYNAYKLAVDSADGFINIRYVTENGTPAFAPDYQIPALKDFIEGDLNKDGCNDLMVSVYHSENGRPRLDIYCYITKNRQLKFYEMYTGRGLGICEKRSDTSGRFFPSKIENGLFIGGTDCYQNGDPGCCPSLEMITYFKFEDGLKFVKQEKKKVERPKE